jgi:hypothetical protein
MATLHLMPGEGRPRKVVPSGSGPLVAAYPGFWLLTYDLETRELDRVPILAWRFHVTWVEPLTYDGLGGIAHDAQDMRVFDPDMAEIEKEELTEMHEAERTAPRGILQPNGEVEFHGDVYASETDWIAAIG